MKFDVNILHQNHQSTKLDKILLAFCITITLFIPGIKISDTFYLNLEELFIPIMTLRLLQKLFFWFDRVIITLLIFSIIVFISILVNDNRTNLNEYFELYKIGKFLIIYVFTIFCFKSGTKDFLLIRFVWSLCIVLIVFNSLHYIDFLGFNNHVTTYYDTNGIDLQYFGKNSEGGVGAKRIIGTMGNPNMNAILFLFFFAFFIAQLQQNDRNRFSTSLNHVFMLLCAAFVLLCQSRTGLVALCFLYISSWYFRSFNWKYFSLETLSLIGFYFLVHFGDPQSLQYISNTSGKLDENNSVKGRKEIWLYLVELWKNKPILGYGPNKNFMYSNNLHPESQYIFYLWRYGVIGLVGLLAWLLMPVITIRRELKKYSFIVYSTLIMIITSLMSNPLDNSKISILFAISLGYSLCLFYEGFHIQKKESNVE